MADVVSAQNAAFERVHSLLAKVDGSLRIPGGDWTAHQLVAHLVSTARRYSDPNPDAMAPTPRDVDVLNDREIDVLMSSSMRDLVSDLAFAHAELQEASSHRDADDSVPFHAGLTLSPTAAAGEWLGELLVHGRDLARAAGVRWTMSDADSLIVAAFTFEVLPAYIDTARIRRPLDVVVKLRGGTPQLVTVRGRLVEIRDAERASRPHAVIAARPSAWVLLGYGRTSLARAIPRGLLVLGGNRPWRALEFQRAAIRP